MLAPRSMISLSVSNRQVRPIRIPAQRRDLVIVVQPYQFITALGLTLLFFALFFLSSLIVVSPIVKVILLLSDLLLGLSLTQLV